MYISNVGLKFFQSDYLIIIMMTFNLKIFFEKAPREKKNPSTGSMELYTFNSYKFG